MRRNLHGVTLAALGLGMSLLACSGWLARSEGIDPATLPESLRPDYAVFAERCSKCHSLGRPLSSGIDDDDYWAMYVARMRRQPASGISQEDTVVILRYLHYFSEEQKAKKAKHEARSSPPPLPGTLGDPPKPPRPVAPAAPPSGPAPQTLAEGGAGGDG